MLKRWSLANFKSFKDETQLDLAPITVLAGANSSGKSTIIQSILLLKQTIQYVPGTRAIGLNGPLLKLGRFDDIKNTSSQAENIQIAWELDELSTYRGTTGAPPYYYGPRAPIQLKGASFSMSFGLDPETVEESTDALHARPSSELRLLQPSLESVSFAAHYVSMDEAKNESQSVSELRLQRAAAKRHTDPSDKEMLEEARRAAMTFDVQVDPAS